MLILSLKSGPPMFQKRAKQSNPIIMFDNNLARVASGFL